MSKKRQPPKDNAWREHKKPYKNSPDCDIARCPDCGNNGCATYDRDMYDDRNKVMVINHAHFLDENRYPQARNYFHVVKGTSVRMKQGEFRWVKKLNKKGNRIPPDILDRFRP